MARISHLFVPGVVLFLLICFISGWQGSIHHAALSLGLFGLLCFTAFPLSRMLFRDFNEAVIFAFPIGFILHSLGLTILAILAGFSVFGFLVYFALSLLLFLVLSKREPQPKQETTWNARDYVQLSVWLFALLAVLAVPYALVGTPTAQGLAYRAYFNSDFFRNLAVSASMINTGVPPENPYFAGEVLRYHWFFQVIPSFSQVCFPAYRADHNMVQFSLLAAVMFGASLFVTVRKFTTHPNVRWLALPLLILAGSYDGILAIQHLHSKGSDFMAFRDLNIDGLSRWLWQTPQVDTLLRTMLYGPQHLIALTTMLLLLCCWDFGLKRSSRLLLCLLLFICVAFSTFIAGMAIAALGMILLLHAVRSDRQYLLDCALFALGGLAFLLFFIALKMFTPDSGHLIIGPNWRIVTRLPWYYLAEWGALGILGPLGWFWNSGKLPQRVVMGVTSLSFIIIMFASLDLADKSVFSIKFGYVLHLCLFLSATVFLDQVLNTKRWKPALIPLLALVIPAALTPVLDLYNTVDVRNNKFTTYIDPEYREVLRWIRTQLPKDAVVQSDLIHDEGFTDKYITEIPVFGRRKVFLSDPVLSTLFQIPQHRYEERSELICSLFRADQAGYIHHLAARADIDYILVEDISESLAYPHLVEPYFTPVKKTDQTVVFRVNDHEDGVTDADIAEDPEKRVLYRENGEETLFVRFGQNFYPPEHHEECEKAYWMSDQGVLVLNSRKELNGILSVTVDSITENKTLLALLDGKEISREWIAADEKQIRIPVRLVPGKNRIVFQAPEGTVPASHYGQANDTRQLSFKFYRPSFTVTDPG